ncbi:Prp8 binding protein [Babesia microti strain RI]|uniref:Prp8 binding protein n=1 Tax=Babesia microti (strain RI) TaxID=1133968 RepID=A0A1N6LWC2_BABMR|nr:Prp8 binding protein [Babesia microti strain RI]SIO73171.1 Prp8 binding protein [Babesia microti strain RI]|eukprot:XP_021337281.1 Prp8 binding protein [Babesia microti strain RI]
MSGATDLKAPVMLLTGHTGELFALSFSPNGKHLASSGLDREIFLFNVFGDCENIAVLKGHKNAVIEVHWSHDNDFIFSCSADETLGLWDVEYRKRIKKFVGHCGIVNGCYGCGERCIVSASDDGCVKLWDIRTKKQINSLQHDFQILSVCADSLGEFIYCGSLDNIIRVYDSRTFKQIMQLQGHKDCITSVHLNNNGTKLASNSMDQTIIIWDVQPFCQNNTRIESTLTGPTHDFEHNLIKTRWGKGSLLASGSADSNVYVFDTLESKMLYKLGGHSGSVNDVALHPHQPILASCSSDKTIYLGELI